MTPNSYTSTTVSLLLKDYTRSGIQIPSAAEERAMCQGPDWRNRLAESHIPFAIDVAGKWWRGSVRGKIPYEDMVSVCLEGLVRASRTFEPAQGKRFLTYAVWWIENKIHLLLGQREVHLPMNVIVGLRVLARPSISGLSDEEKRREMLRAGVSPGTSDRALQAASIRMLSLSERSAGDTRNEGMSLAEMLPASVLVEHEALDDLPEHLQPADELTDRMATQEKVRKAVDSLEEREAEIVRACFGLDGKEKTLAELGQEYGLSRERIRQIKEKALGTLRKRIAGGIRNPRRRNFERSIKCSSNSTITSR